MGEFPNKATQFKPGNPGGGRPKGTRSLSTIIRELTENPPDWDKLPLKGKEEMAEKFKNKSAWEAIVYVAMGQALAGDQQAREFLGKRGYGDKLDITSDHKPLPILGVASVPTDPSTTEDTESQKTD